MYTPKKTRKYEEYIKASYISQLGNISEPSTQSVRIKIEAELSIPKSTTKKTTKDMILGVIKPNKKPDIDNIAKIVLDGLNKFLYQDDKQVVELTVSKKYSETPLVRVNYEFI